MEIKQVLPNNNKTQKQAVLSFHSCNECFFLTKTKEDLKGSWEGRKALMCCIYWFNIMSLETVH